MFKRLGSKISKPSSQSQFQSQPQSHHQPVTQPRISPYPAASLATPDAEFRLLTIYPGRQDQEIECNLSPASFQYSLPGYEAVSSTPGSGGQDWQIVVNGQQFAVTEHVSAALRTLRYEGQNRSIWLEVGLRSCAIYDGLAGRIGNGLVYPGNCYHGSDSVFHRLFVSMPASRTSERVRFN